MIERIVEVEDRELFSVSCPSCGISAAIVNTFLMAYSASFAGVVARRDRESVALRCLRRTDNDDMLGGRIDEQITNTGRCSCPDLSNAVTIAALTGRPQIRTEPGEPRPSQESTVDGSSPDWKRTLVPAEAHLPERDAAALPARSMQDIMGMFQSLGDNCEFGLIQRWADAEPLDLLRFAGFFAPIEHRLMLTINALRDKFIGLGHPASVVCELHGDRPPRQYMIRETRWNLLYHTDNYEGRISPAELHTQQVKALQFKRRKLLEDLKTAHRVFVWKSNLPTRESEVRDLVACLRRYGRNLLLWVSIADADHPAGLVEYAGEGLLKGYVTRFAPYDAAGEIEFHTWHTVCRAAADAADRLRQCGE